MQRRRFLSQFRSARPTAHRANARLALERLEDRTVLTTLSVGTNYNVAQPSAGGSQSECTVAIDKRFGDSSRLFAACNLNFYRYSTNGGVTWTPSSLSGIPAPGGDNQAVFDPFGNLFVTYLSGASVRVVMSSNGGQTFTLAGTFTGGVDQPSIAAGWGGPYAAGSVWVSWNLSGTMRAAGAPVHGLGSVGAFGVTQTASAGSFGGTAVGPNGQVTLTYQNPYTGIGPSTVIAITDPDGLGPAGFGAPVSVSGTNVGGFAPIPAQPSRTIDSEANVVYDYYGVDPNAPADTYPSSPYVGRLYLVYTDRPSTASADTDIYVRISNNNGATWSNRVLLNDDFSGRSQFLPAIAVDHTTGWVGVTWYDARRHAGNTQAEIWGTVSVDGGLTWEPNVQIGAGLNCGTCAGGFNFGDYDTMDFAHGAFYRIWADNTNPSQLTPINFSITQQDPGIARVDVSASLAPGGAPGGPGAVPAGPADAIAASLALPADGSRPGRSALTPRAALAAAKGLPIALEAARLPQLDGLAVEALIRSLNRPGHGRATTALVANFFDLGLGQLS